MADVENKENEKSTVTPDEAETKAEDKKNEKPQEEVKTVEELLKQPFRIVFKGSPQSRTTSVSSSDLGTILDVKLEKVREIGDLAKAYLFCIDGSNTVADTTSLGEYILSTENNISALRKAATGTSAILTVQYVSRHRPPDKIPEPPTLTESAKDEDKLKGNDEKDTTPVAVKITTTGLVMGDGKVVSTHPAEMTDKEWNYVMATNSLLHGMFLDTSNTFQKARYPAFELKASKGNQICAPAFEVNDDSSVTITEVKTTFQHSMAQHSFNSSSVAASASGGFGSISAGVSASASWSSSHSSASSAKEEMDCLHASYNFPRVKVFLDSGDLVITKECQELLETIKTHRKRDDVTTFYRTYGHIFAGSVQLGGRLHATKESKAYKNMETEEKKDALKVAAAASFSTPYASGSLSASHANNNASGSGRGSGKGSESMAWEAQGGETLLASNPTAWIPTVGSFYNWRVVERHNVHDIVTLLKYVSKRSLDDATKKLKDAKEEVQHATKILEGAKETNDAALRLEVAEKGSETSKNGLKTAMKGLETALKGFDTAKKELEDAEKVLADAEKGSDDWPAIFRQIEGVKATVSDPMVVTGTPPNPDEIHIANAGEEKIQVAVSNAASLLEASVFQEIEPGNSNLWTRTGHQCVFINAVDSNRVVIAKAKPGSYDIRKLIPDDPMCTYHHEKAFAGYIGIKNDTANSIHVKVTTPPNSGASLRFFEVHSGTIEYWARSAIEIIFIKHSSSNALLTYLGKPGFDLHVGEPSDLSLPDFNVVKGSTTVDAYTHVLNAQCSRIYVKVSSATYEDGHEDFNLIKPGTQEKWHRFGEEVIFVNGPHGTAVGAYYGTLGNTLVVDHHITKDGK